MYMTKYWAMLQEKYPNGGNTSFEKHLYEIARPYQERYSDVMQMSNGSPVGIEFTNKTGEEFRVILPEMSEPGLGAFRTQSFNKRGFNGHMVYRTLEAAVEDMTSHGYFIPAPGAMDRLSATQEWEIGMIHCELIRKVNSKMITWEAYYDECAKVRAQYGVN